jgi:hypothetical protein
VFEIHGAQIEAILLFDKWLDDHHRDPDPDVLARVREIIEQNLAFDAELGALLVLSEPFLTGGRRSGKTFLMEAILCSYAVAVPGAIVWTVALRPSPAWCVPDTCSTGSCQQPWRTPALRACRWSAPSRARR